MTKKELIEELAQFPDDMPVLVNGYEGGYDNLVVCKGNVVEAPDPAWYDGTFMEAYPDCPDCVKVIILARYKD